MANDFAVLFTTNTAVVIRDPKRLHSLKGNKDVLFNPRLGDASNFRPCYWYRKGDEVKVMTAVGRKLRDKHIKYHGLDTGDYKIPFLRRNLGKVVLILAGMLFGYYKFLR